MTIQWNKITEEYNLFILDDAYNEENSLTVKRWDLVSNRVACLEQKCLHSNLERKFVSEKQTSGHKHIPTK